MKTCNQLTSKLLAFVLALAMILPVLPTETVKALDAPAVGVSGIDFNSLEWTVLPDKENRLQTKGSYTGFYTVNAAYDKIYYHEISDSHYYFKLPSYAEMIGEHTQFNDHHIKNNLTCDPYVQPYFTYLEYVDGSLYLLEGQCETFMINVKCPAFHIYIQSTFNTYEATIARAKEDLFVVVTPANPSDSSGACVKIEKANDNSISKQYSDQNRTIYLGNLNFTEDDGASFNVPWMKDRDEQSLIKQRTDEANARIDALPNDISSDQKKDAKSQITKLSNVATVINDSAVNTTTEIDRLKYYLDKMSYLADLLEAAANARDVLSNSPFVEAERAKLKNDIDTAISNTGTDPLLSAENTPDTIKDTYAEVKLPIDKAVDIANLVDKAFHAKEAIDNIKGISDADKAAAKAAIDKARDDAKADVAAATTKEAADQKAEDGKLAMDRIVAKAELDKKAKDAKDAVGKMTGLSDAEKKTAKDAIDKAASDAKANIDKAATKDDAEKAKKDGLDAIDAAQKNAQKQSDANDVAKKANDAAEDFIKKNLTDENGNVIKTVTETNIIKIYETVEKWNTLDQTTKELINKLLQEKIGKTFETLKSEADKLSKKLEGDKESNSDVGDDGSIVATAKVKNKTTTLKWNKVEGADGYFVYGNLCNSKGKKYKLKKIKDVSASKTSLKVSKRKAGKWYKYRIMSYKKVGGKKVVTGQSLLLHVYTPTASGKYANPAKVTVKKSKVSVKVGKKATIKASTYLPKGKKLRLHTETKFRFIVSDPTIAKVNKKTCKITGKKKGKCDVYVCAQNGLYKKISVTVK